MSSALAIAGVTAVLRDLLNDGVVNHNVSDTLGTLVSVTALPLQRVLASAGTPESSQLNVFLYQVTPNGALRNSKLPAFDGRGAERLSNPPLALDLHYLVTAFGSDPLHTEILLGYAMQILHERPVLSREAVRRALSPSPLDAPGTLPAPLRALEECGLAEQDELLRITMEVLGGEEMSRLWTAFQAPYRPTAAYRVSVVLIEATRPTRAALPVLTRGIQVQPDLLTPFPWLAEIVGFGAEAVARIGDRVQLRGARLAGSHREVILESERFDVSRTLPALGDPSRDDALSFELAAGEASALPVGLYRVAVRLTRPGEAFARETGRLALMLLPHPSVPVTQVVRTPAGVASFDLGVQPDVRPGQSVSLLLGEREVRATSPTSPRSTLHFDVPDARAGQPLVRLRIDGVESASVDRSVTPPRFLDLRLDIA